jgi:hypothetical protein
MDRRCFLLPTVIEGPKIRLDWRNLPDEDAAWETADHSCEIEPMFVLRCLRWNPGCPVEMDIGPHSILPGWVVDRSRLED